MSNNWCCAQKGRTALTIAALEGSCHMVEFLVQNGAHIDKINPVTSRVAWLE